MIPTQLDQSVLSPRKGLQMKIWAFCSTLALAFVMDFSDLSFAFSFIVNTFGMDSPHQQANSPKHTKSQRQSFVFAFGVQLEENPQTRDRFLSLVIVSVSDGMVGNSLLRSLYPAKLLQGARAIAKPDLGRTTWNSQP